MHQNVYVNQLYTRGSNVGDAQYELQGYVLWWSLDQIFTKHYRALYEKMKVFVQPAQRVRKIPNTVICKSMLAQLIISP